MRRFCLLIVAISIHIMAYGDVQSQCKVLFAKSKKELKSYNYAKALEYLAEAKTIATNQNSLEIQIGALNNIALIYMEILDYEKAIECYLEAYQMTIKEPHKYKRDQIILLNNITHIYFLNEDFNKAKEYVHKAYKEALKLRDSLLIGISIGNLALLANQAGDLELAENYLNTTIIMLKNQTKYLPEIKIVKLEILYLKKEYNKAERLALDMLDLNMSTPNDDFKAKTLLWLSRIYQEKKDYPKAIKAAKDALSNSPKLLIIIEVYEQLSKLYLKIDSPYLAGQYLDSLMIANDSLAKKTNMDHVMNSQVKFDLINSEQALAESRVTQKEDRMFFIFIITAVILAVLILIWVFYTRTAKNRQSKVIAELELEKQINEKLLAEQRLKEREILLQLEQQRLNDEIAEKNRQLTTKILCQSNRNELIKEIIRILAKIPKYTEDTGPILKSVTRKLKAQIKESMDWDSILVHFEQINPSFLSALKEKHPDLTADEIRLLSYIYLNLNTKEISKLFNIAPESCQKKKYRLAQKMNITTSEMYCYLTSIGEQLSLS